MNARRIEASEGQVVEFLDEETPRLGLVLKVGRERWHLLDERGRENSVSPMRVYLVHELKPVSREDFLPLLEALRAQIEARRREIELELLWESLRGKEREYTLPELAEHYFGTISAIAQSAMLRALWEDRFYFRRRGVHFIPRSSEDLQRLRHQEAQRRQRAEFKARVLGWLRQVLASEEPVEVSEEWVSVVDQVESFLRRRQMPEVARWLAEVDENRAPREIAYDVLVKTGRLDATADPFLILAGLDTSFRAGVLEAAERLVPFAGDSDREDFTRAWTVSIDDEETEEIDDALSVEPHPGGWRLGIHIADVAHYVRKGDALDEEAARRGVTAYLPTERVLMFPERLSCNLASLREGELRPTLSLLLQTDAEGNIREATLVPGMIRVTRRLSYDEADRLLAEDSGEEGERLRHLLRWVQRWAAERFRRGALWLRRPEVKVRVRDGLIRVKRIDPGSPARFLVSELMILMNHLAAEQAVRRGIPIIFRTQDPPAWPLSEELREQLRTTYDPLRLEQVIRGLQRSRLSLSPQPHAGLGVSAYTQWTSPIRRFADLVVQRQIRSALLGEPYPYEREELLEVLAAAEAVERDVRALEQRAQRYWLLQYIRQLPEETEFEAVVLRRAREGYDVELSEWLLRGKMRAHQEWEPGACLRVRREESDPQTGLLWVRPA